MDRPDAFLRRNTAKRLPEPKQICRIASHGSDTARRGRRQTIQARIASKERIYAIGDVHGRLDLFTDLVARIREDSEKRCAALRTRIILMGDIVDRGPDSAPLVERIRAFASKQSSLVVLRGNHEDIMADALRDGDEALFSKWVKYGGAATLRSWGISNAVISGPLPALIATARKTIPTTVVRWMRKLPLFYRSGDFFFVHAGIRPGVALWRQSRRDMLWIGKDFTRSTQRHPAVIVHGHSIVEHGPEIHENRIALDTGAYRTGKLSAMGFEEDRQWVLST